MDALALSAAVMETSAGGASEGLASIHGGLEEEGLGEVSEMRDALTWPGPDEINTNGSIAHQILSYHTFLCIQDENLLFVHLGVRNDITGFRLVSDSTNH